MTTRWVKVEPTPLDGIALAIGTARQQREHTALGLLSSWDCTVAECEQGSILSIDDYLSDLCVRDYIQAVLESGEAKGSADYAWWSARVEEVDARLRSQFRADVEVRGQVAWWRRGVLIAGGPQYEEQSADVLDLQTIGGASGGRPSPTQS